MTKRKQNRNKAAADAAAESAAQAPALLGFLAVSATAGQRSGIFPGRMIAFPIMPGTDESGPVNDLNERLARQGNWQGYAVLIDADNGTLRVEPIDSEKGSE